ncbi:MAG: tRNA dihydrouridine synthase DusB [Nitrospinae bacterium]|nr:tRNA dihydrouridine synthase DusB [Nitrospinota bacterium]
MTIPFTAFIGGVRINSPAVMAPIAGITDRPFRRLVMEHGAGLCVTELLSANAIVRDSKKTFEMFPAPGEPGPVAVQVFGAEAGVMRDACSIVEERAPCDIIDLNFGCPVKKVAKTGAGAAMLKDVGNAAKVVEAVVGAVKKPVTVKIRIGWDFNSVNAVDMTMAAEEAGVAAVIIHGRTASQGYSGKADWDIIAKAAQAVKIPVIGNGDIVTPEMALSRLKESGCAMVMIGRGALGKPWIFRQVNEMMSAGSYTHPSHQEIGKLILRHLEMMVELYGQSAGIRKMRAHFAYYIRGVKSGSRLRQELNKASEHEGVKRLIAEYFA